MQVIWDLCKKGSVRKAQKTNFSKVQFAFFPTPKGTGKKKEERPKDKCHRAGTRQAGHKMTERATGSRTGETLVPLRLAWNAACTRVMETHTSRTCAPVLEHRSRQGAEGHTGWTPFTCQMFFLFSIPKNKEMIFKTQWLSGRSLEQLNVILN